MLLIASCAVSALAAWSLVRLATSHIAGTWARRALTFGLTICLWGGLNSCAYFAWLALVGPAKWGFLICHAATMSGISLVAIRLAMQPTRLAPSDDSASSASNVGRASPALIALFAIVCAVAAIGFVFKTLRTPYGHDDALETWNLHARMMYLGGDAWQTPFIEARQRGILFSPHPDYPLGLSSLVAFGWSTWGDATPPWIPAAIALLLLVASVAVVAGGAAAFRGPNAGLLAGSAVAGTVGYVLLAASQYADVPLSAFIVSALVCLMIGMRVGAGASAWFALVGAMLALAAWTKNEGLLFAGVTAMMLAIAAIRQRRSRPVYRELTALLLGALPAAMCLFWFKTHLACTSDLLAGQAGTATLARLSDPSRYVHIAVALVSQLFNLGKALAIAVPLYWLGTRPAVGLPTVDARQLAWGTLLVVITGYCAVYLVTPLPLAFHLGTSMGRLLAQLWPSFVFLVFATRAPLGAAGTESNGERSAASQPITAARPHLSTLPATAKDVRAS